MDSVPFFDEEFTFSRFPDGIEPFIQINKNVTPGRKPIKQNEDDISVCECKYDANRPDSACEERCLNVLTSTECTPGYCPCGNHCKNQRFQKCEYAQTKLFKTEGRGWGLLADEQIKAGQFVIEYCGEIISSEEAKTRSHTYEAQGLRDAYIISLDANYYIDATKMGSQARFINHSCQPNCETRKWTVLGETRVGIFAKQNISIGTELAYDYNFEWYGGANVRCLCGAFNCSIFLGAKSHGFQEHNHVWEDDDARYTVDAFPLYDSAEDDPSSKLSYSTSFVDPSSKLSYSTSFVDPSSKLSYSTSFVDPMYIDAYGSKDNTVILDDNVGYEQEMDFTTLFSESFHSVPLEGVPVNSEKLEVKDEPSLSEKNNGQDFPQTNDSFKYSIGSGSSSKKKNQHVPKSRLKNAGRKQVNGKNVAKLFVSKEAQEEIVNCEELRTEANNKLNTLYDEIRPVIEEHARDSQDNVPTSVAQKWIEASCAQWKAEFDLHFAIVKNVVCPRPRSSGQTNLSEGPIIEADETAVKYLTN